MASHQTWRNFLTCSTALVEMKTKPFCKGNFTKGTDHQQIYSNASQLFAHRISFLLYCNKKVVTIFQLTAAFSLVSNRYGLLLNTCCRSHSTLVTVSFAVRSTHWFIHRSAHEVAFAFCGFLVFTRMTIPIKPASSVGANTYW